MFTIDFDGTVRMDGHVATDSDLGFYLDEIMWSESERYWREAEQVAACMAMLPLAASNVGQAAIRRPADAQATRFATNPNWSYRGDNTKYREVK